MLDISRPVTGRDVESLRQKLGLTSQEMTWMLGLPSMARWSNIVKKKMNDPINDVNISLIVRVLDEYPELNYVPDMPTPADVMDKLNELSNEDKEVPLKKLGIILGGEASAGYRWLKLGTRCSPAVRRTCLLFMKMVQRKDGLKKWEKIVNSEANSRRIPDVWNTGKWK